MKKQKGFTLLELLVVVALIGIFASIVLVALDSSRKKGKDASIRADLAGMRSQSQLYFANNNNFAASDIITCGSGIFAANKTAQGLAESLAEVEKQNGTGSVVCAAGVNKWAVSSPLSDGTSWCVDHQGSSKAATVDTNTGNPTFATCI